MPRTYTRNPARYAVTSGLSGCYMPDNGPDYVEAHSRRELAAAIRAEIEARDFPASTFAQVQLRRLWRFIARNGSSVAHFSIRHGAYEIAFSGLTADEARQFEAEVS